MNTRLCPACNANSNQTRVFLEENFDQKLMSSYSYASRKLPEFMCHRLVQCQNCDLVFADNPPTQNVLANAYHVASFDSAEEAEDAAQSYKNSIIPILNNLQERVSALEIGAGTGIFLEKLMQLGFTRLVGVEPSTAAIASAPAHRKKWIRESIFVESDFEPNSFDLVCCFMTLEHVADPKEIISAAYRLLKPGGAIVLVTHDYRSLVNKILGKRSPIIDIEHLQLFSEKSLSYLLKQSGFVSAGVKSFKNRYALRYWLRLLPIPNHLKLKLINVITKLKIDNMKISINVGNLISYGYRPLNSSN